MTPDQLGFFTLLKKEVMRFWVRQDLFDVQWTSKLPNAAPGMARPDCGHRDVSGGGR